VIDHIFFLKQQGYQVYCLRGNHEEYMLLSREDTAHRENWGRWGGRQTMDSFDLKKMSQLNQVHTKYWDFMESLPYFFEIDEYILVHAGLSFATDDPFSEKEAMIWIRPWDFRVDKEWLNGRIIVHGHTPVTTVDIKDRLEIIEHTSLLDIDNGCFRLNSATMGKLCAFELTQRELYFQPNIDPPSSWDY
jgi:serine/threonine protein phosphatase 1